MFLLFFGLVLVSSQGLSQPGIVSIPLTRNVPIVRAPATDDGYKLLSIDRDKTMGCPGSFTGAVNMSGGVLNLIIDTGSSTMAVAGGNCASGCPGISPKYSPGPDAIALNKNLSALYFLGSWEGNVYNDSITFAGLSFQMAFASIFNASNFWNAVSCYSGTQNNRYQGVLGMAYPTLLLEGTDSLLSRAHVSGNILSKTFAVQMCRTNGYLWLGGYNSAYYVGNLSWIPLQSKDYYDIKLADISLGGQSVGIDLSTQKFPVDTGAGDIILSTPVFNVLAQALDSNTWFQQQFGVNSQQFFSAGTACIGPLDQSLTMADFNANMPNLTISIQGVNGVVNVDLTPVNSYLYQIKDNQNRILYCPGISNGGNTNILGWTFLNQLTTVFDVVGGQIGIAPTYGCDPAWQANSYGPCCDGTQSLNVCVDGYGEVIANKYCSDLTNTPRSCLPSVSCNSSSSSSSSISDTDITGPVTTGDDDDIHHNSAHTLTPAAIRLVVAVAVATLLPRVW